MTELRSAWRNVRARGWRAALTIGLLAMAIAATTIVFSGGGLARVPAASRIRAGIDSVLSASTNPKKEDSQAGLVPVAGLDEWAQAEPNSYAAVHGHLHKVIFLTGRGEPRLVKQAR